MNMRNLLHWLLLTLAVVAVSCQTNDDTPTPDDIQNTLISSGKWRISYYWDKDKEETGDFSGYTFSFKDNGVLEAVKGSNVSIGQWQISSSSNKLIINISNNQVLDEINDDWLIIERTAQRIKLRDDNDEHLEELHFTAE